MLFRSQRAHDLSFDRRKLKLPEAIRRLGLTEVKVQLHPEVEATLRVEVIIQS